METLLALAIMSVASLALFQSTATLLRLSERTVNAALNVQDVAVMQKSFTALVRGMVAAWPKDDEDAFVGTSSGFSGLTRTPFHTLDIGLTRFSLSLDHDLVKSLLVYRSGDTEWILQNFSISNEQFSYLGEDNVWRQSWPPEETPEPGDFGDAEYFDPPTFPLAIRLQARTEYGQAKIVWIAALGDRAELPVLDGF